MDCVLQKSCLLLNEPEQAAHAVEDGVDENDNETEAAMEECFVQPNLLEACENVVQAENKVVLTTRKYLYKFRTAVLVVQVIRNLIKIYRDYASTRTEPISFTQYAAFETDTESLLFDRSYFKAKMEMLVSSEAQFILSSPPDKRTIEDCKLAMLSLRATVDTFAEYPVHIQEQLAKVGWYEWELALKNVRQVRMWAMRDSFRSLLLLVGSQDDNLEKSIDEVMEYYLTPTRQMCGSTEKNFGPGRVIIRQGHVPQNFYLILSGTAVVTKVSRSKTTGEHFSKTIAFLKKGKYFGDVAILTNAKRNATVVCHDTVSLLAISRQDFLNIFLNSDSQKGPEYVRLLQSIDLLSGWPIHKLPYNNPRICLHTFYRQGTVITKDSKASSKIYVIKTGSVRVLKSMTNLKPLSSIKAYKLQFQTKKNDVPADRKSTETTINLAPAVDFALEDPLCDKYIFEPKSQTTVKKQEHTNGNSSLDIIEEEYLLPILQSDRQWNEKAETNSPDRIVLSSDQTETSKIKRDGDISRIFIHLQTLRAGDIFGLVYIIFEDTLSMALVSDGAECIVISKDFFKKQMDEDYIQKLSRYVQPYPSKEMLQQRMQDYNKWKTFKTNLTRKNQ